MRFMVVVKASKDSEAGALPDEQLLAEMGKYNEELAKAGILLAAEGLQPSSKGARVKFSGSKRTVVDGPFTEAKEVVGGYAVIEWESREKAIAGAVAFMRLHSEHWPSWEGECEVRPITFLAP